MHSDMWDRHWCKGATARTRQMAPRMNELLSKLRQMGVLIVHGPSDTLDHYRDHPARRRVVEAKSALPSPEFPTREVNSLPLPVDASDEGCWCEPRCKPGRAWSRQIDAIEIDERDAITDSDDIFSLLSLRGIKNALFMGVHLNMCVLNRHFTGNDLVIEHIEKHLCPTTTSDEFLGGAPFRFSEDQRSE